MKRLRIHAWASLVAQTVKNLPADAEDPGSVPGLRRSPGEGNNNRLRYACLRNPMDRGAWWGLKELDTAEQVSMHAYTRTQKVSRNYDLGTWALAVIYF